MNKLTNSKGSTNTLPVTLKDVARVAGVSISTVSRILDERLPKSKSKSAEKVRAVAKNLGYTRDVMASSLRRGGTGTIGVLVPHLTDTVMAILYEELAKVAQHNGYFTVVATCGDSLEEEEKAIESLLGRRVDGLILATSRLDHNSTGKLKDLGIPYTLALRTDNESASVVGNDIHGGYIATRHLLDLGHTRIGIVAGPNYSSNSLGRTKGYEKALIEAGLKFSPQLCIQSRFDFESGEAAGHVLFALEDRPTAIFAVTDNLALGVMSAAKKFNLLPGKDFALIGYNDTPVLSMLPTPISSVHIPLDFIAYKAIELLFGDRTQNIVEVMPSLIPRYSSIAYKG
ncbi:LacI family DNA-binding transcriptional regulator [Celerinatantimonas diazotrophica]|uniref:LacI family transcriptional regulator n=1 Tax=Celerinatantimonas diazotrophica TaxID=412034 RepID=A0A4R1K5D6_9GAMM|nr:LacI family DNA-binding transcriptional regulator [Celerinatantimonas diazotrophica]TCK58963.1 LacI family transcriptional regulator [Celerinatantimonas diazotrophica]CAG9297597.1 Ribose operon repressor [Celerinatantimonas diazotrophica]